VKITFVLPYAGLQGGIRVIAIHAERLARRGHEVRIVSTPRAFAIRHTFKSLLLGKGWPKDEPSYFEGMNLPHRVLERVRGVRDADIEDGDVVVATYYTTAAGVVKLSPSKGAKALFIQGYEVEENKKNATLDASWRMPMHKIIISRWLVELARIRFGDTLVSHVPNSVDLDQFNAPPRARQSVPTIGMLYHPHPIKGCRIALRAIDRIAAELPSLRLVCFGTEQPDFTLPLPRFAEFHCRPPQDQLRELYAQCDVWICGSLAEGFHLPPLEAMACRCPVVSTRVGGPMDIIEEGVNGHLVDVKDDKALADRALHVLRAPQAQWASMSDAAWRTATRYGWDDAAALFEQALYRAIERTPHCADNPPVPSRRRARTPQGHGQPSV
jgi:glycosyltransferase involved in cell wall biosynthesis